MACRSNFPRRSQQGVTTTFFPWPRPCPRKLVGRVSLRFDGPHLLLRRQHAVTQVDGAGQYALVWAPDRLYAVHAILSCDVAGAPALLHTRVRRYGTHEALHAQTWVSTPSQEAGLPVWTRATHVNVRPVIKLAETRVSFGSSKVCWSQ
jgi:hypothetical protein